MISRLTFSQAINLALMREMESDPAVFVFGVDAQDHKRLFGSGAGLSERFGSRRLFGSPLSEAGATGIAIGAALSGLRPVHVHTRADFLLLGLNQLANVASSKAYVSQGRLRVPLVVRALIGRSWGQGPQHSKSMHSVFAHFPGLKVVLPASPQDGYGLLRSAIRDDNPVVFLEHRWLYDVVGEVDDEAIAPLGRARIVRPGGDVTLVTCSWMTPEASQAADILARHGVQAEIVDVRTVAPLDTATILASVARTGRLVVADYDWTFCGLSAEVVALVTESHFQDLKAPPARLGFAPVPCPTTRPLEQLFYPSALHIVRTVERMLDLAEIDVSRDVFNAYEHRFKGPF